MSWGIRKTRKHFGRDAKDFAKLANQSYGHFDKLSDRMQQIFGHS